MSRPVTRFTPNGLTDLETGVLDRIFGRRTREVGEATNLRVDSGANQGIGGPLMSIKTEVYPRV